MYSIKNTISNLQKNKKLLIVLVTIFIAVLILIVLFVGNNSYRNSYGFGNENFESDFNNINISEDKLFSSVVVVGTARNIEKFLPTTLNKIQMICNCFQKSNVIIYENDSNDKTLEILQDWARKNVNVEIITEKSLPGLRTQRIAWGRNIVMKKALELNAEYIVVMDLDDVNDKLSKDAFLSTLHITNIDWAAMTANQTDKYYDLWALRTYDDWMPFDCWECVYKEQKGEQICVNDRYKHIDENEKPILVKSAFGGLGIYKTKYLANSIYDGGKDNNEVCEHVSFNENIMKNGGKVYINPKSDI